MIPPTLGISRAPIALYDLTAWNIRYIHFFKIEQFLKHKVITFKITFHCFSVNVHN